VNVNEFGCATAPSNNTMEQPKNGYSETQKCHESNQSYKIIRDRRGGAVSGGWLDGEEIGDGEEVSVGWGVKCWAREYNLYVMDGLYIGPQNL
jgi:hypothetical protein